MLHCGQVLQGRYQLGQNLGENASRQTWLATDLEASNAENSKIIVKFLTFGGQFQWENLKLFEREAQVLKQLNHSQIPTYRDYFCIDDRLLYFGLVQEYISGSSLKEVLNQGKKFSQQQIHKIALDVLNILIYLHELSPPVLHRDIKPSNLILGEDEQIYLVDFGAVQDKAAKEGATFTIVGTYGYTPIEQFGGRAVPASDLYALGATLIHLLTGTAPADLPQRDLRIQFSDRVSLSPSFINWLEQLTEPDPERRFNTTRQALAALESDLISFKTDNQTNSLPIPRFPDAQVYRPLDSRVELNKSSIKLEIKIPSRGTGKLLIIFEFIYLAMLCLMPLLPFIISVSIPLSIEYLLLFVVYNIIPFFRTLEHLWGSTQVNFYCYSFEIKRQLFKVTYFQHKVATSHIQDVSLDFNVGLFSKPVGVTITSGSHSNGFIRRSFGRGLTEAELIWLVQEIREWLQAQK